MVFFIRKCCLITVFSIYAFANANAQQHTQLQEVFITAPKFQEKLSRTGKVVSIIDSAQLAQAAGKNVLELLQLQAGVQSVGTRSAWGANQELYVRGSGTGQVLILLDGFPLNDPSHISQVFDWNLIDISQLQRIEILKGGQSTLYGSDAMAGVINMVSKSNAAQKTAGSLGISGGNLGFLNSTAQIQTKWKEQQFAVMASHLGVNGFSAAAVPNGESDGFRRNLLRFAWNTQWKEKWEWSSQIRWSNYKGNLDAGPFTDDKDYTSEAHALSVHGQLRYQLARTDLFLRFFSDYSSRRFFDDSTDVPKNAYNQYYFANYSGLSQGLEWYGKSNWGKAQWVYGLEYRWQHAAQNDFYYGFGYGFSSPEIKPDLANQQIFAGFLTAQKEWGRFGVEIGGRYNRQSTFGTFYTYSLNPYLRLSDTWKVFANVYTGFKVPSLYQLYSAYGNQNLMPERSGTSELGIQFRKNSSFFRVVYFKHKVSDGIGFQSKNVAPYGQYFNIGAQESSGIEGEVSKQLGRIKFSGNYTYLQGFTEVKENAVWVRKDFLVRRPAHQWVARVEGNWLKRWTSSMAYQWVGERVDLVYNEATYQTVVKDLKGYTWLEASVGYQVNARAMFSVSGKNVLNKTFSEQYGYNGLPLFVQLGANYRF